MTPGSNHISLGEGSEFDLVRALLAEWGALAYGIGDDTATFDVPQGQRLVVSVDASIEGVHFRREWLSLEDVGARAVQAALSDLAAAGAAPLGVIVALQGTNESPSDALSLGRGIARAVREHETTIRGGNITRAAELGITTTVIGGAPHPVSRAGARPGDQVYVTGVLGGPRLAIQAWSGGAEPSRWARQRFAHATARLKEGQWLARAGATAMIDVSDGLAADLQHVAAANHVEIRVDVDRLPRGPGVSWEDALASGEELELVVAAGGALDVDAFARRFGIPLTPIGHVRAAERARVVAVQGGQRVDLPRGHDHFSL